MEREKTVCFTGHRKIPQKALPEVRSRLYSAVARLILDGYTDFVCGGAVGFDTLAAECVLGLKEKFPSIRLTLALPCRDQTVRWESLQDLATYKRILGKADSVHYVQPFYTSGCMHERNRWMVDHSSVCIAYLTSKKGGTLYTYNYAKKCAVCTINVAECDMAQQISLI